MQVTTGSMTLGVLAAACAVVAVQLTFIWAGYAIGRCAPSWLRVRAAAREAVCFALAQVEMAFTRRCEAGGRACDAEAQGRRPVLFIHGVLCNGAVWRSLARRLSTAGFGPLRALDLEPTTADIASHAPRIAAEVGALRAAGGAPVHIVAHSMGGLVARAALPHCRPGDVAGVVTIATPHRGSRQARFGPGAAAYQMRCGSEFLAALNARPPAAPPITSLYSPDDNLVAPAASAVLAGARNVELRGLGHFALLRSRRAAGEVIAALGAAA